MSRHSDHSARFLPLRLSAAAACALLAAGPAGATPAPVPTQRPTVRGDATQGARLVAARGFWSGTGKISFSYEWFRCDPMGRHCRVLHGVHTSSHRLGPNDVGHTISVAVRAADASGATRAFASLVGPIAGERPQLDALAQPAITGRAIGGSTVRVDNGRWQPQPSSFVYQWVRCNPELRGCKAIGGETGQTHAVGPADLGHALVAIVQARSGAAARAVFSTATAVAVAHGAAGGPAVSTAPLVALVLQQGSRLTGSVGSWSGSGAIAYSYSWYRCDVSGAHCKTIHDASDSTYLERARDVGHTLGFAVHATDSHGTTTAYAPLLGPVAAPDAPLVSTGPPVITGNAAPGQTLQVSSGGWTQAPTAVSYQWQRCNANGRVCSPIAGATAATYVVAAEDGGHKLLALVHAAAGSAAQDAFSGATAVVAAAAPAGPVSAAPPTVAGTFAQGSQLTGTPGTWTSAATISYSYNWFRCDAAGAHCLSIHGATKSTYTLGAKDAGHTLGFAVHAADASGTTTAYAALVGPIAATGAALAATLQPAVTGNAASGQALQVSTGGWTQPPTAFAYQWQRCNANGRLCSSIDGATAPTYTVTAADAGHTLIAVVTGTFSGTQQATLSVHTSVVA